MRIRWNSRLNLHVLSLIHIYLFHSVPYYSMNKGDLEDGQYNKLGDYASLGCVRMCVRDVTVSYTHLDVYKRQQRRRVSEEVIRYVKLYQQGR